MSQAGTVSRTLSFSRLSTFGQCPKSFELKYVHPIPPDDVIPNGAGLGGSAVHDVIKDAEEPEAWREEDAWADQGPWADRFRARFRELVEEAGGPDAPRWGGRKSREFPAGEDFTWWIRKGGPLFLRRYAAIRRRDDQRGTRVVPGAVELEVGVNVEDVHVRGFVDVAVLADTDGQIVVRDWKTGTYLQPVQLATYAWLLGRAKGWTVETGQFGYLRGSAADSWIKEYDLRPWLAIVEPRFRQLSASLQMSEDADLWPWNPSMLCVACTVRKGCEWGQTLDQTEGGDRPC